MMLVTAHQGNSSMSWLLKNKKDLEREQLRKDVDAEVVKLKLAKEKKAIAQKKVFEHFNKMAQEYGRDGIWYVALGGEEKK